ncbi:MULTISPECIES: hypothetical protein [unclassified Synechocystis]|uniref:hypothetical protein n=1 Tax=unclassified Synechocystis TaxID=2640012 RepID=UPI00040729D6|nr:MULTISPECIES: hypothetical protein [unclassified Synechocystis]AIE75985.1 hypothetical protein D082_34570 [Synechocystis sp. PCC 6714]MCT0255102.1 hypothetical protein [Synechocystis sp. CS-94]
MGKIFHFVNDEKNLKYCFFLAIVITLAIFLLKFSVTGFGVYGDGLGYYTPLRSLLFDGDLRVDNEYSYYAETAEQFNSSPRVFGPIPEYSKYTLGLGIVLLPFFALGHLAALVLHQFNSAIPINGMSWPYELFYCLGSVGLGITSLALSYRFARRYFSHISCLLAVGGIWFASPLSYYLFLEVSMSHAVSAFLIALFLYGILTKPWLTKAHWQITLGLAIAFAAWVRPQDVLFFLAPILVAAMGFETKSPGNNEQNSGPISSVHWKKVSKTVAQNLRKRAFWQPLLVIASVVVLMQIPQLLIYLWQYGGIERIPYLEEGQATGHGGSFNWLQPSLWQVLFSGHRGLFVWHPITLLSIVGLIIGWQLLPRLNTIFLVTFLAQVYFIAAWWSWWQGASVGGRMFSNCTFLLVFGVAGFWQKLSGYPWQKWAVLVTLLFAFWNLLIVLQYQSGMIPPEEAVTLTELYQNQFRIIPFFANRLLNKF